MALEDIKEALQGVVKAVDEQRRKGLRDAFASPDQRAASAALLLAKFQPLRERVAPATWDQVVAQIDRAAATGDTAGLEGALDAADAEMKAKR